MRGDWAGHFDTEKKGHFFFFFFFFFLRDFFLVLGWNVYQTQWKNKIQKASANIEHRP